MTKPAHESLLAAALDEIPIEYRDRFEALAGRPGRLPHVLRAEIDTYARTVRQVSAFVTALDPDLADAIASTCRALIDRFADGHAGALVTALVTYFVEESDDEDVTGVLGFDDDVQVANALCRVLGAPELVLPLRR